LKLIRQSYEILDFPDNPLEIIEDSARVCYQSHDKKEKGSAKRLVKSLIKSGHHTPLESVPIRVRFIVDRGLMAEITRHRIPGFCVESSRWCNYSKDRHDNQLTFVSPGTINLTCYFQRKLADGKPHHLSAIDIEDFANISKFSFDWINQMFQAEKTYLKMIDQKIASPQYARSILPFSLKTEMMMFTNLRELRLIFKQRIGTGVHPDLRRLMVGCLNDLWEKHPVLFEDIYLDEVLN